MMFQNIFIKRLSHLKWVLVIYKIKHITVYKTRIQKETPKNRFSAMNTRAGNSINGFPSESLVFCPKMSE